MLWFCMLNLVWKPLKSIVFFPWVALDFGWGLLTLGDREGSLGWEMLLCLHSIIIMHKKTLLRSLCWVSTCPDTKTVPLTNCEPQLHSMEDHKRLKKMVGSFALSGWRNMFYSLIFRNGLNHYSWNFPPPPKHQPKADAPCRKYYPKQEVRQYCKRLKMGC